jgi:alpha,alpha-trehalase
MPDGAVLNRYWDERDAPRDESYAADARVGSQTRDPHATYRNLRAAAESGWDFSSRWFADGKSLTTIHTVDLLPPDLNSLLFGLESAIARGCAEAGDRVCASRMRRKASARSRAIRKYLWNLSSGTFDDYDWRTGRSAGNISAAAFYPLFLRVATPAQAKSTARLAARELVKEGGLVTTNRVTGEQWDAPNGWAPLQWIAVNGLRNYGEESLARTIGTRWLGTVSTGYSSTGKLLEKYDVLTRRPGGGGEYPLQDGFGWTNGVAIGILQLYPKRADRITPIRAR